MKISQYRILKPIKISIPKPFILVLLLVILPLSSLKCSTTKYPKYSNKPTIRYFKSRTLTPSHHFRYLNSSFTNPILGSPDEIIQSVKSLIHQNSSFYKVFFHPQFSHILEYQFFKGQYVHSYAQFMYSKNYSQSFPYSHFYTKLDHILYFDQNKKNTAVEYIIYDPSQKFSHIKRYSLNPRKLKNIY